MGIKKALHPQRGTKDKRFRGTTHIRHNNAALFRIQIYPIPVTEEIRQFLLNDHLYIRYSSGCCRTTSELKLKSDIPPYLLVPGSHHPRFAASFPYGLLSPSQLFLYTLSIIGWGKSICQVFSGIFSYYMYVHFFLMEFSQTASGFSGRKVVYYYRILMAKIQRFINTML